MASPIDRRRFLTTLGLGSVAVVVSCSDDGRSGDRSETSVDGGTPEPSTVVEVATAGLAENPFRLGVASGDPTPTSVILWTRLIVGDSLTSELVDIPLTWEVAVDEAFGQIIGSGIVEATAQWGYSVHLDATDLAPATEYFYRFRVDDYVSPTGRTRTAPADDQQLDSLNIVFASCQNYAHGYYTAHDAIAADRADAVFFLGDFIYESAGSPDSFRPFEGDEPTDLWGYRSRYELYLSDESLQRSRASAPWIVTWDDHEVENNTAGNTSQDGITGAEFANRRAAAYAAYYEHQPLRVPPPVGPTLELYRSIRFGTLAEFFVLDGRQYRDDQPCGDEILTSRAQCADFEVDRTMLGPDQERWIGEGLAAATTTWKVLAQQTVMSSLVIGDIVLNVDQWDGYPQARDRLLSTIVDHDIDNVVVLTGDIHSAGAGTLHTGPELARIPVATEFVGTSITSNSLIDAFPGGAEMLGQVKFEGIEYLNVVDHGYCRCTITPQQWRTEYVVVDTTVTAAAPMVDATAVVDAGTTAIRME